MSLMRKIAQLSLAKKIVAGVLTLLLLYSAGVGIALYQDLRHLWRDRDLDFDFGDDDLDPPPPDDLVIDDPIDDAFKNFIANPNILNILLIGVDQPGPGSRRAPLSDSIMVFSINRSTGKATLLSIPRDTYVHIEGRGRDKINHSHALGGARLLRNTVENFLGIPIHFYFRIDFEGFSTLIDFIGGVQINVENDIPNTSIRKGPQVLNGSNALTYVRYRGDSDFGRAGRQQQVIIAVARQIQREPLVRLPGILNEAVRHMDTDMPFFTLLDFANKFSTNDPDMISRHTLQGRGFMHNGIYYFQADMNSTKQFLADHDIIIPQEN